MCLILTFTTLLANSEDDRLVIWFFLFPVDGIGISCELSILGTVLMRSWWLFSRGSERTVSECRLLKILLRAQLFKTNNVVR